MSNLRFGEVYGLERCPQCGVAKPLLQMIGDATYHHKETRHYTPEEYWYFSARCSHCRHLTLFTGKTTDISDGKKQPNILHIIRSYPENEQASTELPERAIKFLQQALESRHAPDGALMLAASSIDAMLKEKGYRDGSLFNRIEKAAEDHLLTEDMKAWAHEIRLGANEPRHADEDFEGATSEDADQILAFARALGEYLFVLPARVSRWKEKISGPQG